MNHRTARFVFGPLLLALVVGVVWWDLENRSTWATGTVVTLLGVGGLVEFRTLLAREVRSSAGLSPFVVGGAVSLLACGPLGAEWSGWAPVVAVAGSVLPFAAFLVARRHAGVGPPELLHLGLLALGLLMVVVPMGSLLALLGTNPPHSIRFGVVLVLTSKFNDIGAYLVGTAVGKTRLCPGISPKKSWEGAVGGLLLGVAGSLVLGRYLELAAFERWQWAAGFGLSVGLVTQCGDLFESAVKRGFGVKDSGRLIPAFGGVLDLVDSLIFAAPLGYALALSV